MTTPASTYPANIHTGVSGKLEIVQVWRFLAAAVVVNSHAFSRIIRIFPSRANDTFIFALAPSRTWGHFGVDFFFVISGFIMAWTNWDRFGIHRITQSFLARRLVRIVPVYWFATSAGVALLVFAPSVFSFGQRLDSWWIISSYLFIPSRAPGGALFSPVIGLGWTLNYEMYFYIIFGLLLFCRREMALFTLSIFLFGSAILGSIFAFHDPVLIQNTSWLVMEFVVGVWVAVLVRQYGRPHRYQIAFISCISLLILIATIFVDPVRDNVIGLDFTRFVFWGIPCAGLLYSSLFSNAHWLVGRLGDFAVKLGNGSYSIYIFQIFTLPAIARTFRWVHLDRILPIDGLVLLLAALSIAIGYFGYLLIEKPLSIAAQTLIIRERPIG